MPITRRADGYTVGALPRIKLRVFLDRSRRTMDIPPEVPVDSVLEDVLSRAVAFVPCVSAALYLDNPITKQSDRRENDLVVIASIGVGAYLTLPGSSEPAYTGIPGKIYLETVPFLGVDEATQAAVIGVPVAIEKSVCGALILRKRPGEAPFTERELKLIAIFADYMASVLMNALDAEKLRDMAHRDPLTGLYNDRFFHGQLTRDIIDATSTGQPLCLVFMDLDHFKEVNDTHGHMAGSMVLKEIGYLMRHTLAMPGAVLARYGGDEFVMIFAQQELADVVAACERLRETIEKNVFLASEGPYGPPLRIANIITCSMGVASFHDHVRKRYTPEQNKDVFLKVADKAMYAAKDAGRNRVVTGQREPGEENERY
ncbi:MAG: GGDEF domain-containing protein [Deltaproteobacteria bacterium]|nr:GGDEF domain-containing protein [Deltaproteobacteria bacterium]